MDPRPDALRNQLLDAAAERSPRYTQYQQEVNTMLSELEAGVRTERRMVIAQWLFLVLLCTAFNIIGGYKHETMTGMWFAIQGVFWFLFGTVFLLSFRFSQLKLDLLKEIKRVEVAVLELKELQAKSPASTAGQG
jgi:hypothetical protein